MAKKTIAVDIDDVLAFNASGFIDYSNKTWGLNLSTDDYDEHWPKVWSVDWAESRVRAEQYHEEAVMSTYGYDESAIDVLDQLKKIYSLKVLTSRRSDAKDYTIAWIEKYFPNVFEPENIHFAGIWDRATDQSIHQTKAAMVKKLGADFLVDDQPKHCFDVAKSGKNAVLFGDYAWNRLETLPSGVTRCANWLDVKRYFLG